MFKRSDIILARGGSAIVRATVQVTNYVDGTEARIWATDDSSLDPLPNGEVQTNQDGEYSYYAPTGHYTETVLVNDIIQQVNPDVQLPGLDDLNQQTGTSYTLKASDNGLILPFTNAGAISLILPQTSVERILQPFLCGVIQRGAGQITVSKQGSDTIESSGALVKTYGQHSLIIIDKLVEGSPNTWGLYGDLG